MGEQSQRARRKEESASTVCFIAVQIAVSVFTCSNEQVPFCLMSPTGSPQTPSVPGSWPRARPGKSHRKKKVRAFLLSATHASLSLAHPTFPSAPPATQMRARCDAKP